MDTNTPTVAGKIGDTHANKVKAEKAAKLGGPPDFDDLDPGPGKPVFHTPSRAGIVHSLANGIVTMMGQSIQGNPAETPIQQAMNLHARVSILSCEVAAQAVMSGKTQLLADLLTLTEKFAAENLPPLVFAQITDEMDKTQAKGPHPRFCAFEGDED